MPTTYANSINNNPIYAARAEADAAGNTISTTYATKSELPDGVPAVTSSDDGKVLTAIYSGGAGSYSWQPGMSSDDVFVAEYGVTTWAEVEAAFLANKALFAYFNGHTYVMSDMVYSGGLQSVTFTNVRSSRTSSSDNSSVQVWFVKAQSTGTTWSFPDHTGGYLVLSPSGGDEGKVLKVKDTLGTGSNFEWAAAPSVAQVQSDWTESDNTDPSYIQNKPLDVGITEGTGITFTNSGATVSIGVTIPIPSFDPNSDVGKVLKITSGGVLAWVTP